MGWPKIRKLERGRPESGHSCGAAPSTPRLRRALPCLDASGYFRKAANPGTAFSASLNPAQIAEVGTVAGRHYRDALSRLLFLLLLPGALGLALAGQAIPCIAYRANGVLRANCNGKDRRLAQAPGLESYAIGVDGGTVLAAQDWAYFVREGHRTKLNVTSNIATSSIYRSCGAALASQGYPRSTTVDVVAGKKVEFTALDRPHCSEDRSVIVGVNSAGKLVTNEGRVLEAEGKFGYEFAVSPSGRWVAYFRDAAPGAGPQLCIADIHGSSDHCFSKTEDGDENAFIDNEGLSINDAGEALLVAYFGGGCWYSSNGVRASRRRFPGSSGDECAGVAIASPTSAARGHTARVPADMGR